MGGIKIEEWRKVQWVQELQSWMDGFSDLWPLVHPPYLTLSRLFFLPAARKRGPVTTGTPDMKHYRKEKNETNGTCGETLMYTFFPPVVGLLRGGVPHMRYGRSPDPSPHAHHRRVFLRVSVLRELWRRDASETEEECWLSKRVLHCFTHLHDCPHHVSRVETSFPAAETCQ